MDIEVSYVMTTQLSFTNISEIYRSCTNTQNKLKEKCDRKNMDYLGGRGHQHITAQQEFKRKPDRFMQFGASMASITKAHQVQDQNFWQFLNAY